MTRRAERNASRSRSAVAALRLVAGATMKPCKSVMQRRIRHLRTALWLAMLAGTPAASSGQVVLGRLVEAGPGSAVGGAMAVLEDRSGRGWTQALTRTGSGLFQLRAPAPGEYRVRADRIGYATTYSDWFRLSAADTLSLRIEATVEAVSLEGVVAEADRRCRVRPAEAMAVGRVWEEARKALAAAAWTQSRGMYDYELLGFVRQLDRRGRKVESEDRTRAEGPAKAPYVSRPIDSLAAHGYARVTGDGSWFWAPDAEALLADSFLDTHCFRVVAGGDDAPGLVGLAFEPVSDRSVPEIAGTMWLNPGTAKLRRLEYRYERLGVPPALLAAESGGSVRFRELPNGTWIVDSWSIRMFRAGVAEHPLTGRPAATLEGVTVQGGEVLRVYGPDGVVFDAGPGLRIAGVVWDSLGGGLADARVFAPGKGLEATTGPDGAFELTRLQPGEYEVAYGHPYLDELWYQPDPVEVEVGEDRAEPARVEFEAPAISEVMKDVCRGMGSPRSVLIVLSTPSRPPSPPPSAETVLPPTPPTPPAAAQDAVPPWKMSWPHGILMGHVRDAEGRPVADATVRVLSDAYDVRVLADLAGSRDQRSPKAILEQDDRRGGAVVTTNSSGFYRACWLPTNTPLQVAVLDDDETLVPGQHKEGPLMANVVAVAERAITISLEEPHATLDLRTERRTPPS